MKPFFNPVGVIISLIVLSFGLIVRVPAQTMKILVHMTTEQELYLKTQVLPVFERQNNIKILIEEYQSFNEIATRLKGPKDSIGLVKVPFVKEWELVDDGYIRSLNSFLSPGEKDEFQKVTHAGGLAPATMSNIIFRGNLRPGYLRTVHPRWQQR